MKNDLITLIEEIPDIEKLFHKSSSYMRLDIISDRQEFQNWRKNVLQELQHIHDKNKDDSYISDAIAAFKGKMDGYTEHKIFLDMTSSLIAIGNKIDDYYPEETIQEKTKGEPKVFISHSTKDRFVAEELVKLLTTIGLKTAQIFCTSVEGCGISPGYDIRETIREQFSNYNLYVIFLHSENYYNSPMSLNEMGIAWYLNVKSRSLLLPGFDFNKMNGVVKNDRIAIKLDNDDIEVRDKLNQLKNEIIEEFRLPPVNEVRWEQKRNDFIENVNRPF